MHDGLTQEELKQLEDKRFKTKVKVITLICFVCYACIIFGISYYIK